MNGNLVIASRIVEAIYPSQAPFHPDRVYPEYGFEDVCAEKNEVYDNVRACFHLAGLDAEHYGTSEWNPLKELISPGETVLLKPNLVREHHPRDPQGWQYTLTHGSIVRAVADYVWKALDNQGKVILADAPITDGSFEKIVRILGLDVIRDFYLSQGLDFELIDLRKEEWVNKDEVVVSRVPLAGDPNGYVAFDLKEASEFVGHRGNGHYYGADYDAREVNHHHSDGAHEYLIAGAAVKSDVVFNLPKLKTHKKAGITASLKNLVGINGDKNWLPHHTEGHPQKGGDEHPNPNSKHKTERAIVPYFRQLSLKLPGVGPWIYRHARRIGRQVFGDTEDVIRSGNWWGNDTVWRMCLDLNKIALYGAPDGTMRADKPEYRKRHYVLVDGILAGEARGPLNADPVPARTLIFGLHPPSVDAACAYLMGYDPDRIPIVRQAFHCQHYALADWDWRDVRLVSNQPEWNSLLPDIPNSTTLHFKPHFGWTGHIELMEEPRDNDYQTSPSPHLETARVKT